MEQKMIVFVVSRNVFEEFDFEQDVVFKNSEGKDISLSDLVTAIRLQIALKRLSSLQRLFIKKVIDNE